MHCESGLCVSPSEAVCGACLMEADKFANWWTAQADERGKTVGWAAVVRDGSIEVDDTRGQGTRSGARRVAREQGSLF